MTKHLKHLLMVVMFAAVACAEVPFSQELREGNTSVMLGVQKRSPLPGLDTGVDDGLQVGVKSADPGVTEFFVGVLALVDGALVSRFEVVFASAWGYAYARMPFGRVLKPADVLSVHVRGYSRPQEATFK